MRGLRYVVFFLLLIGVGCTTPSATIALIEQSERVAIDYPDSAMRLIASVDRAAIRGKQDMAHYRLAQSEAIYYSSVYYDSDSLTRPLFDYYYDSDNHAERARAMYQHGNVMSNAKKNAEAMYALMEAEKSLQHCDNPRLLALVYLTMGEIYGSECLYNNALSAHKRAYELFDSLSLEFHSVYSLYKISEVYNQLQEYDIAKEHLMVVLDRSTKIGFLDLCCCVSDLLCDIYVSTSQYGEIEQYIDILEDYEPYEGYDIQRNYYKAILYSYKGDREQALKYLDLADSCLNPQKIESEYFKSIVFQNLGDIERANYWLLQNKIQQEE